MKNLLNKTKLYQFLIIYIPIIIISSILINYYFKQIENKELEIIINEEKNKLDLKKMFFDVFFANVVADIDILNWEYTQRKYKQKFTENLVELEDFLLTFSASHKTYNQVRFLDTLGKEVVRVNLSDTVKIAELASELKDKSNRYYIKESKNLKKDEIYFSKIDLNVENGMIQIPYKPMFRIIKKAFNSEEKWDGYIVTNYFIQWLFEAVNVGTKNDIGEFEILNLDGHWLYSKDQTKVFSFMLNSKDSCNIAFQQPKLWQQINQQNEGYFTTPNYTYIFTKYMAPKDIFVNRNVLNKENANFYFIEKINNNKLNSTLRNIGVNKNIIYSANLLIIAIAVYLLINYRFILVEKNKKLKESEHKLKQIKTQLEDSLSTRSEELALSDRQFTTLIDNAGIGVALVDLDETPIYANQFFLKMLGYSKAELLNMSFAKITHPDDVNKDLSYFKQLITRKIDSYQMEKRYIKKDGSPIWAFLSVSLLKDKDNKIKHVIAAIQDINQRKSYENKILRLNKELEKKVSKRTKDLENVNNKLISKNSVLETTLMDLQKTQRKLIQSEKMASLGILSAGIAHEINNPINFISAGTNILKKDYKDIEQILDQLANFPKNPSELKEYSQKLRELMNSLEFDELIDSIPETIAYIETGVNRTVEIINGLSAFSRVDENEKVLASIHDGIDSTLLLLKNKIKNNITVQKVFDPKIEDIFCYPGQLNQVFMNIFINAIDAMKTNGTLKISTKLEHNQIKIVISDDGEGIAEDIKRNIFDPFFTTKEIGKGTGLGLSISHGIIEKHNGIISVNSTPGKGTHFTISLPVEN